MMRLNTTAMPTDPPAADLERRLFDEALDFPAGSARDAWLAGSCCGDQVLRSRILALLRAQEQESRRNRGLPNHMTAWKRLAPTS